MSEFNNKPGRNNNTFLLYETNTDQTGTLKFVRCDSPSCCASEVSADAAVICRQSMLSVRPENTMLHRDGQKAEIALSSNVEG